MASLAPLRDLVIGVSPCARVVSALSKAGACGILDLSSADASSALALSEQWTSSGYGVRAPGTGTFTPADLPPGVHTVLLGPDSAWKIADVARYRTLVEVTSADEARLARLSNAHGLIVSGSEVSSSELSSFVLLQAVLALDLGLPVWVRGGPRVAAAARAVGAAGVVLDSQLALLDESDLDSAAREQLRRSDEAAARFASRHGTVRRAVAAIGEAVTVVGTGLSCPSLGTPLPIAQGPMTRVSDEPGFAFEVASAGGLPFLALALADAQRTRSLMEETAARLGSLPWGVGVLGFANEEIRNAQLEVIRSLRPAAAIIAGGRPAQARELEELGITTFLHVPSPGLLQQFLSSGARRFVFEGSECGGHVGPRTSFPLWEDQIAVLEDFLDAQPDASVDVLFAGGIHDARSAAMVDVLSASLQARGCGVGVLMGTAYLFTQEAVACGAIQPTFQDQVVAASGTELLVSAPGHATRCVSSPITSDFQETEERLRSSGVPDREIWEALEQFNVGRLRIASKGVERQGSSLVSVSAEEQLRSGLFMAGQVAVLRDSVTSVADLHAAVTTGASELLGRTSPVAAADPIVPADIAIIGMACVFPGAPSLESFWSNVVHGVDSVTEVPPHRWDPAIYYDTGKSASKWGGFLPEIPFDPLAYGIPPSALPSIEPTQLLALEVAQRALNDAATSFDRSRASVVFGAESGSDLSNAAIVKSTLPSYVGSIPPALARQLPDLTEDTFPGVLANVISGRIANRLDLGGTNYTVDAACGSSLAALDVAVKELVAGTSDLVLCGGADLHNTAHDYLLFTSVGALSRTGRSRPFDSAADGIALGEGVAVVVLKRLADAERDGDRVYAVIKGMGSSSDGKSLGLTAPRPAGQRRALERAYTRAGVSPASVGLVEAHGTGTVVGDRTELTTLTEVFLEHGAAASQAVLGSVKSQIGHTKCAAGLAGLIKASLAVYTGIAPPTLQLSSPQSAWDATSSPFQFATSAKPWTGPRYAGVSAFGFGGTNFHAVLGAHTNAPLRHGLSEWSAELFTFRSHADATDFLAGLSNDIPLRDLAFAASQRSDSRTTPIEIALVASTVDELRTLLATALSGEPARNLFLRRPNPPKPSDPLETIGMGGFSPQGASQSGSIQAADATPGPVADATPGRLAFLFPGQGSQRVGMLADLFVHFPEVQHLLHLPDAPAEAIFPGTAFDEAGAEAQAAALKDTRVAQPALGVAGLAVHHLLTRLGITPDLVAGHSYGELTALAAAGSFDAPTLLKLSRARAEAILKSAKGDPGTMAAVTATAAEVEPHLTEGVVIANHNSPDQVVISGVTEAVNEAVKALRNAGLTVKPIEVACAFHSPVIAGAGTLFAETLAEAKISEPKLPVWSNRTAGQYHAPPREELALQVGAPVRFVDQIEDMYAAGARTFVEVGPGTVLGRLTAKILGERPHTVVQTDGGLKGFLGAIANLAVSGVDVRTGWLFAGRAQEPAKTAKPGWTVDGQFVRTADGNYLPGGLAPAELVEIDVPQQIVNQDALIAEFLRANREIVAAQRDVLLAHLGNPPAPVQAPLTVPALPAPQPEQQPEPRPKNITTTVLEVIADRTGYPVDMIEPDLDLEADLSIDSIKRTEIAGELTQRLGVPDDQLDELSKQRTAQAIASWLEAHVTSEPPVQDATTTVLEVIADRTGYPVDMIEPDLDLEADLSIDSIKRTEIAGELIQRLGLSDDLLDELSNARTAKALADQLQGTTPQEAPVEKQEAAKALPPKRLLMLDGLITEVEERDPEELKGTTFCVLGIDGEHLEAVTAQLETLGVNVRTDDGPADGLIFIGCAETDMCEVFPALKAQLARQPRWVIGGGSALGMRGLFRTLAREYTDSQVRLVENGAPADVVKELLIKDNEPVVVLRDGQRYAPQPVEKTLGALADTGAGPAGDGVAEAEALGLTQDSVLLLIGGARGVTVHCAKVMAAASRCRIELVGRTPRATTPESPEIAAAVDAKALRNVLARTIRKPAEIEKQVKLILAQRELEATIGELSRLGSEVRYHATDVLDESAVRELVKEIHTEHGRIDGVVHAAGVIEDKLVADKDPESFRRVFRTKVDGARTLLDATADLPNGPRFAVLFGSIASTFGNRGQVDYAAANDALETLGGQWADKTGSRALTVHWGPWAPTASHGGMVTEQLSAEYARRGISLMDPEEGALSLLRELAWGDEKLRSVVYTASGW
ncbi:SDR family oxidoreductase [Lentzea alba]|uniref:SDR family oxidoreductase n=1 Tax=Lentzea alba TaxID=2714351 RepID=UPI0039BED68D